MSEAQKKISDAEAYKKDLAKQRRLKKLRKMKQKDRAGDVAVSEISDVEVRGDVEEESQDAWLNDLLKSDGDHDFRSMETTTESENRETFASKFCIFAHENSLLLKALLGVGIVTVALTIFARLRK